MSPPATAVLAHPFPRHPSAEAFRDFVARGRAQLSLKAAARGLNAADPLPVPPVAAPCPDNNTSSMAMSHDSQNRNILAQAGTVGSEPAVLRLGQEELTQGIAGALRRAFGATDAAVKRIMRAANCNERAAKNWLAGRNAPNALYLLRLMATVPELQAEVRRLTAMEADMAPEFERDFIRLLHTYQGMRNGGA